MQKGQVPFDKYIFTQLKSGHEFKAKEIRRFEIFANGYKKLFKDKIMKRYEREKEKQTAKYMKKWEKERQK